MDSVTAQEKGIINDKGGGYDLYCYRGGIGRAHLKTIFVHERINSDSGSGYF